ncbi:MAG: non-canonical purine NTP pyrophosphatase [Thermoplasmata archaeon]|nr:non-canonical purine NTP pyrophosphatase [Thermoplasmata archaeon]
MDVRFVTSNRHKYREAKAVLAEFGIDLRWSRRTLAEPQADDLAAVVRAKLDAVRGLSGLTLVEDSGLEIPALAGFPGVYSSYVLRTVGLDGVLRLLRGRPRSAVFRAITGVARGSRSWVFPAETRGRIATRARGSNGFGYDPIFVPAGSTRTFAELDPDAKSRLSHRGRSLRDVGRALEIGLGHSTR